MLILFFTWTAIAIVAATTTFIGSGGATLEYWLWIAGYMLMYFYAWMPISVSIYWLVGRLAKSHAHWLVQLGAHALYLAIITLALPFLLHPATWDRWLYGEHSAGFHALNIFIYSTVVIASMMLAYLFLLRAREKAAHEADRREAALEQSLVQSKMEALRAQINPHFLFNTLNSIASLVESSSNREAYKVIELLAALLRNALEHSKESLVTLEEEFGFLEAYVEIEKIRYAQRLIFSKSVPEHCLQALVPALSLQPLVENAIKHAVAASSEPVRIEIDVSCGAGRLSITVSDDGPGLRFPISSGVGLTNVRERLAYLFGNEASLEIDGNDAGGATVTFSIPDRQSVQKEFGRLARTRLSF